MSTLIENAVTSNSKRNIQTTEQKYASKDIKNFFFYSHKLNSKSPCTKKSLRFFS